MNSNFRDHESTDKIEDKGLDSITVLKICFCLHAIDFVLPALVLKSDSPSLVEKRLKIMLLGVIIVSPWN